LGVLEALEAVAVAGAVAGTGAETGAGAESAVEEEAFFAIVVFVYTNR
jgi:hypothetical protein